MSKVGVIAINGNELTEILNDVLGNDNLSVGLLSLIRYKNDKETDKIEFLAGGHYELELSIGYRKLKD